jgi:two-component system chemotaxis response regulator CheB
MAAVRKKMIAARARIRVLVVDDSVVIRRLVTQALSEDAGLEVVGSAANGAIALAKIPQVSPDVITLDVEMPEVDGLETLRRLRKEFPHIRVIMFSTLTTRGATATIDALMLGADDYVTKAADVGQLSESLQALRRELVPKINQFFVRADTPVGALPLAPARPPVQSPASVVTFRPRLRRRILAIGVSTGGPTALAEVVPLIPADFPLPVVIVQHMPPLFTRLLAERLQKLTALRVEEGTDGAMVTRGRVFIAPGDHHMRLRTRGDQVLVTLGQGPAENSCRPAVDVLFRSVEEVYGGEVISVVLTGMGQDGLRGVEGLRSRGAYVIAQDEATSVVWGMPGAIVRANLADAVVPLDNVVSEILRQL